MKSIFKFAIGAVAGAAAGMATGLLIAPEKGEKSRKRLMKKTEAAISDMKDKIQHVATEAQKKIANR